MKPASWRLRSRPAADRVAVNVKVRRPCSSSPISLVIAVSSGLSIWVKTMRRCGSRVTRSRSSTDWLPRSAMRRTKPPSNSSSTSAELMDGT